MTREEAIKHIKDIICENNTVKHSDMVVFENEKEALHMAIQALSQEPCDAVSREAVIEWLKDKDIIKLSSQEETARRELNALPSVNPQPCTDAVSRDAVMRLIENKPYDWSNLTERHNMLMEIRKLPSVTQKSGKWIDGVHAMGYREGYKDAQKHKSGKWQRVSIEKYIQHAMAYYECSECGGQTIGEPNYCPNCGADMRDKVVEE